jgi:hypothetical protein
MDRTDEILAAKLQAVLPHLDERQRRLLLGAEARALGHGGIRRVASAAGVAEGTVSRGVAELEAGDGPLGRTRREGGGRKRLVELDPGLVPALLALVEPDVRGDPMSPLRWTTKSTRRLAEELRARGWQISPDTVANVLRAEGFSLQANAKTLEGKQHPDRDAQFRYLNEQVKDHQATDDPVISVDTKKKQLVGPYKNNGRQWRPKGEPVQVNTHDFLDRQTGKAIPYGIYDVTAAIPRFQVAPAPHRNRQQQVPAVVDAVHPIGGRGDHDRPGTLADADPGTRRPPHHANDIAIGDPAALIHRTDHVRDVHRTRRGAVQRRQGKRRPTPTRRTGPGTRSLTRTGNHRRHNRSGHHDHPHTPPVVTHSDQKAELRCSRTLEHKHGNCAHVRKICVRGPS